MQEEILTFVDDVPVCAFASVSCHDSLDVSRHNLDQRSIVESTVRDPSWKLRVPDEGMATHLFSVLSSKVGDLISASPVPLTTVGLDSIPFHGVLGSDGAKFGATDETLFGVVVADSERSTKVFLALCNHSGIERLGLTSFQSRGR
jgi:hypothetical protein